MTSLSQDHISEVYLLLNILLQDTITYLFLKRNPSQSFLPTYMFRVWKNFMWQDVSIKIFNAITHKKLLYHKNTTLRQTSSTDFHNYYHSDVYTTHHNVGNIQAKPANGYRIKVTACRDPQWGTQHI